MREVQVVFSFLVAVSFILVGCNYTTGIQSSQPPTSTFSPTRKSEAYEMFYLPDWVNFNMSLSEIKSHYNINPVSSSSYSLAYEFPYKNYDFSLSGGRIFYFFRNGTLGVVSFAFEPDLKLSNAATHDYLKSLPMHDEYLYIKNALIEKYGKPIKSNVTWRVNTYKNDLSKLSTAIVLDQVNFEDQWVINGIKCDLTTRQSIMVTYTKQ